MRVEKFVPLGDLEVYKLAREISKLAWSVYERLTWEEKKLMGEQFIRSADSVGANIAEGYRRYHSLDQIKFYYTSRASLSECCSHWVELLAERGRISAGVLKEFKRLEKVLSVKLSRFISAIHRYNSQSSSRR